MTRILTPSLIDAQEMHRQHPETFSVPTEEELNSIKISDRVKVCNGNERFWVEITDVSTDYLQGIVKNPLVYDCDYNFGYSIKFKKENIYIMYTKEEMKLMTTLSILRGMKEEGLSDTEIKAEIEKHFKSYE